MPIFQNGSQPSKPIGSEVQQETVPNGLTGLTRTITFVADDGSLLGAPETSGVIAAGADAATIQAALEAMTAFAPGDIAVEGSGQIFTYSFGGALANKGFKRMYATYSNGQKVYFETVVAGVSLAAQEAIRQEFTRNALGGAGTLVNSAAPTPRDIGDPLRYDGKGRVYTETLNATGGTRTLTVNGQTTAALAFDATAAQIQTALEALNNVAPGDVTVSDSETTANTFIYKFGGALRGLGTVTLSVNPGSLTGGSVPRSVVTLVEEGSTLLPQFR